LILQFHLLIASGLFHPGVPGRMNPKLFEPWTLRFVPFLFSVQTIL
jgi:hypothetical protein